MKRIISFFAGLALFTFCISLASVAHAGVIDFADFPDNVLAVVGNNPSHNDDELFDYSIGDWFEAYESQTPTLYNWIILIKDYETMAPIDISMSVTNSGGTTEYLFIEGLANGSGTAWLDYHVELIYDDEIIFSGSLDFDTPDATPTPYSFYLNNNGITSQIFSLAGHTANAISWDNGVMPPINDMPDFEDLAFVTFSLDIPDIVEGDGYEFVLRQYPTVPEPATMLLFGIGALGFGFVRRKSR